MTFIEKFNEKFNEILKKSWSNITGILAVIFMIFGGGYSTGIYKCEIDCKLDKIVLLLEYQEKLKQQVKEQKENEVQNIKIKNETFDEFINFIKNKENEK